MSTTRPAVVLSGHVRSLDRTAGLIQRDLISPLGADVFAHSWTARDHTDPTWWRTSPSGDVTDGSAEEIGAEIAARLNARRIKVERALPSDGDLPSHPCRELRYHPPALESMWRGFQRAVELVLDEEASSGIRYSHIVRWRYDLVPNAIFQDTSLTDELLIFCSGHWSTRGLATDCAFIAPRNVVSGLTEFARNPHRYLSQVDDLPSSVPVIAEEVWMAYLRQSGIPMRWVSVNAYLLRDDNEVTPIIWNPNACADALSVPRIRECPDLSGVNPETVLGRNLRDTGLEPTGGIIRLLADPDFRVLSSGDTRCLRQLRRILDDRAFGEAQGSLVALRVIKRVVFHARTPVIALKNVRPWMVAALIKRRMLRRRPSTDIQVVVPWPHPVYVSQPPPPVVPQ